MPKISREERSNYISELIARFQALEFFVDRRSVSDKYHARFRVYHNHFVIHIAVNYPDDLRHYIIYSELSLDVSSFEKFFNSLTDKEKEEAVYNMDLFV